MTKNIFWHSHNVTREKREELSGHQSFLLWFTGLSGSGKSTLAGEVERELYSRKRRTYLLDGDNIRHGLSGDLGFSTDDRRENIRRIAEVSHLMVDAGLITLAAFISPTQEIREKVENIVGPENFFLVHVNTPLEVCEERDPKGLYKKARAGDLQNFTGVTAPFEVPKKCFISTEDYENPVRGIVNRLEERGVI